MNILIKSAKMLKTVRKLSAMGDRGSYCCLCSHVNNEMDPNSIPKPRRHPVMMKEVVEFLKPTKNSLIIDMTFGSGGHSRHLLENIDDCKIIALDRDPAAREKAKDLAWEFPGRVTPLLGKFSNLPELLKSKQIYQGTVDCILFEFGCSSLQLEASDRGFSLDIDGPLDLRMDGKTDSTQLTAYDILAKASEEQLYKIFKVYGQEKRAKKIARAAIDARYMFKKLETTHELCDLVDSISQEDFPMTAPTAQSYGASKVLRALRIFVNNELNEINYGMHVAQRYLKLGGRLVTISYNTLEDTIVKRHLTGNVIDELANPLPLKFTNVSMIYSKDSIDKLLSSDWQSLTKHVVIPSYEELESNPTSTSAKLRAAIRIR